MSKTELKRRLFKLCNLSGEKAEYERRLGAVREATRRRLGAVPEHITVAEVVQQVH